MNKVLFSAAAVASDDEASYYSADELGCDVLLKVGGCFENEGLCSYKPKKITPIEEHSMIYVLIIQWLEKKGVPFDGLPYQREYVDRLADDCLLAEFENPFTNVRTFHVIY